MTKRNNPEPRKASEPRPSRDAAYYPGNVTREEYESTLPKTKETSS